jgi:mRNA interferase MazF
MKKDFEGWHKKKSEIEESSKRILFQEREVWFASLGLNVGHEQNGGKGFLRPVLIIKKFNNEICWCLPLTKRYRKGPFHFPLCMNNINSFAILSQLRLVDVKRLVYKINSVEESVFKEIKTKLTRFLM